MKGLKQLRRITSHQRGLTLIEILVVLTIISVLGMLATPLYQGYRLRTKVGLGVTTMAPVQRLAAEHFILEGRWPADNAEAGARAPDTYTVNFVTSVAITDSPVPGSIEITYDNSRLRMLGNDNTLIYYPEASSDTSITWSCDRGSMNNRYRPANCRT